MSDVVIDTATGDGDRAEFSAVDANAFAGNAAETERWFREAGDRVLIRVARQDGRMVGGYALLPAMQYLGGRAVPAQCVVTVSVDARHRRRGIAGLLMRDLVAQARDRGGAVAPLTASTTALYRMWGWEVCGRHISQRVRADVLTRLRGEGEVTSEPSVEAMLELRRSFLHSWDGPVEQPPGWIELSDAVYPDRTVRAPCVGWVEQGALTGYLRYELGRQQGERWMRVRVEELIASTPDAMRGLLRFLGGFWPQTQEIVFSHSTLPLNSALLYLVPDADKVSEIDGRICWMQRFVDVERAVAARGWRGADATLPLEVSDPVEPEPRRWVLEVAGGRGSLSPGGEGRIRVGAGALAAWFSGWLSAVEAARFGVIAGSAADLEAMDAARGVCRPWMPDGF